MVKLRGHHLLCLHGFRGLGYDENFIANLRSIHDRLKASPETLVEVLYSPDDICKACPNLSGGGCTPLGEDAEPQIRKKDLAIIERLGLTAGSTLPSGTLFLKAAEEFGCRIEDVCSKCDWLSLGWCAEGLKDRSMAQDGNIL